MFCFVFIHLKILNSIASYFKKGKDKKIEKSSFEKENIIKNFFLADCPWLACI